MKTCSKCSTEKELTEFNNRKASLDGKRGQCRDCEKAQGRKYSVSAKDKISHKNKLYAEENKEALIKKRAARYAAGVDRYREIARARYSENREAVAIRSRNWRDAHRGVVRARKAHRRAAVLQRTPTWADPKEISAIYANCPTEMHVDHVIPLQGELVSGLHVPENLAYLTPEQNLAKSNKFDVSKA